MRGPWWKSIWSLQGTIGRGQYFGLALGLSAVKIALDCFVASRYGVSWNLRAYVLPSLAPMASPFGANANWPFWTVILTVSAPFQWIGLALTVRRLRSASRPLILSALFFFSGLNLALFAYLCIAPERSQDVTPSADIRPHESPSPFYGIAAVTLPGLVGAGAMTLGAFAFDAYGWTLFLATPFGMGLLASLIYAIPGPRSVAQSLGVASLSIFVFGMGLLVFVAEGALCIVMALPLAIPGALLGGLLGAAIGPRLNVRSQGGPLCTALVLAIPAAMELESGHLQPPLQRVTSSIVINALPEEVWERVVGFSQIPPPEEWMFRAGIAYPVRAEIIGTGVGAIRRCHFSTGYFEEPITIWDAPRLLRFSVTKNPPPMRELTPWGTAQPPHLEGHFVSEQGQFRLVALPGGRTLLEGTTWYRHKIFPSAYWSAWSGELIHAIHMRVLKHVKRLCEEKPGGGGGN